MTDHYYLVLTMALFAIAIALVGVCIYRRCWVPVPKSRPFVHYGGD